MDGKVDFVCCDFPSANRLTLHILAAVAEHEREMIRARTKAGLAAAKARGVRLGNTRNLEVAQAMGARGNKVAADAFAARVLPNATAPAALSIDPNSEILQKEAGLVYRVCSISSI
jgi:Resolvase, N terminal domain